MFSTAFSKFLNPNSGSVRLLNKWRPARGCVQRALVSVKRDASLRLRNTHMESSSVTPCVTYLTVQGLFHFQSRAFPGWFSHHRDRIVFVYGEPRKCRWGHFCTCLFHQCRCCLTECDFSDSDQLSIMSKPHWGQREPMINKWLYMNKLQYIEIYNHWLIHKRWNLEQSSFLLRCLAVLPESPRIKQ